MRPNPGPVHRPISFSNHKEIKSVDLSAGASAILFETLSEPNTETFFWDVTNLTIDTDDRTVAIQVGTGATPTYQTGAVYGVGLTTINAAQGTLTVVATATSRMPICNDTTAQQLGNATGEVLNARIFLNSPGGANFKHIFGESIFTRANDSTLTRVSFGGSYDATTAVTAIRFLCASATMNFAGGRITQYAVRYR